jgi:hypothetical protein
LILLRDFLRRTSELVGDGISQIIITLSLADMVVNFSTTGEMQKGNEISLVILDIIGFILNHLHLYVNFMGDDFEALFNLLNSLHMKSSSEVVSKTSIFQKDLYNLFWDQKNVCGKFKNEEAIFGKVKQYCENTNKLYYTNENIFFQRFFIRFYS